MAPSLKMSQTCSPDITWAAGAGQGWLGILSSGTLLPLAPAMWPHPLLSKGPASLACSSTFMLCGLEQGLALSESYLTDSHPAPLLTERNLGTFT